MPFSYSGNPGSSERDEVRFTIQDVDESCPLLTDAEIDYVLDKWMPLYDSVIYAASIAAGMVARKYAKLVNVSDGNVSAQMGDLQARYTAMADQLRKEYTAEGNVGGETNLDNILAGTEFDPTIDPLAFSMGLHDNLRAGRQNYGGFNVPTFDELGITPR